MKIRIKTPIVEVEVEDNPTIGNDDYTKRNLPDLPTCIKSVIDEAIKLHNEVSKDIKE